MPERRIVRSRPRRPAWLYPVGTKIFLKDGRVFEVVSERVKVWVDHTHGYGGGDFEWAAQPREWREVRDA